MKNKFVRIIALSFCLTFVLMNSSCLNPAVSPTDKKDIVTDIKDKTFVVDDWTYTGEKKTEMTLDDFRAVVEECRKVYSESEKIVLADGLAAKNTVDVSDASKVSYDDYFEYLSDLLTLAAHRLKQICGDNLYYDEYEMSKVAGTMDAKNSDIFCSLFFVVDPIGNPELSREEWLISVFKKKEDDVDYVALDYSLSALGLKYTSLSIHQPKNGIHESLIPSAEEISAIKAIIAREAAANPGK